MKKEEAIEQGLALVNRSAIAMLGTTDAEGYPNIRALIKVENEDLRRIWFSTNTSSRKVPQLKNNPKACVYFVDFDKWIGLMLVGKVDVLQDSESRQRLWQEGDEKYYPKGVNDTDYSVLRFTSQWGNFYHALSNIDFEL